MKKVIIETVSNGWLVRSFILHPENDALVIPSVHDVFVFRNLDDLMSKLQEILMVERETK